MPITKHLIRIKLHIFKFLYHGLYQSLVNGLFHKSTKLFKFCDAGQGNDLVDHTKSDKF